MTHDDNLGATVVLPRRRPQMPTSQPRPAPPTIPAPGHAAPMPGRGFVPPAPTFYPPLPGPGHPPISHGFPPPPQGPQPGETNTLATLSVVFAFVFAPVGAVLGHLALGQIRARGQRGRDRALIGLTLSYVVIVVATVTLIVSAVTARGGDVSPATPTTTTATTTRTTAPRTTTSRPPRTSTTTVTPPAPAGPRSVRVDDLRVGDCVEVHQTEPDPAHPGYDLIELFASPCVARDGVFRVDQIATTENACPNAVLTNKPMTVFACVSRFA